MRRFFCLLILYFFEAKGRVEIGLLRNSVSTLHSLRGNCSWQITVRVGRFITEKEVVGPNLLLEGTGPDFDLKCVLNGSLELHADIVLYDETPSPVDISLDLENSTLQWSHAFHPSVLPPDFELVHEFNLSYLVHMTDRDDEEAGRSVAVHETSLDIDDMLDSCRRQEFTVQAVINETHSENSSSVSGFSVTVPEFTSLSASLLVEGNVFTIQLLFILAKTHCLSVFIVAIEGLRTVTFNVTSTDMEDGEMNFDLPPDLLSGMDVCSVRGVISGGNDIGNSTTADIQFPTDCLGVLPSSMSEMSPTATSDPIRTSTPTLPGPTPHPSPVIYVVITAVVVLILVGSITVVLVVILLFRRKRNKGSFPVQIQAEPAIYHYDHDVGDVKDVNCNDDIGDVKDDHHSRDKSAPAVVKHDNSLNVTCSESDPLCKAAAVTYENSPLKPRVLNYPQVIPCSNTTEAPRLVIAGSKGAYVSVDHIETDKRYQERVAAGALEEESISQQGNVSIDPHEVGLVLDLHLELLQAVLAPIKAKWFQLGLHLNLSENFLDETETNIETADECLSDMLKNWLQYHKPSMEKLNYALSQIGHSHIAFDASHREFVFVSEGEGGCGEGNAALLPAL